MRARTQLGESKETECHGGNARFVRSRPKCMPQLDASPEHSRRSPGSDPLFSSSPQHMEMGLKWGKWNKYWPWRRLRYSLETQNSRKRNHLQIRHL